MQMLEVFNQLGISPKELEVYNALLEVKSLTAAQIAKSTKESRTNTYMILERLVAEELVTIDETQAVRQYKAASPVMLRQKLMAKQQDLKRLQQELNQNLPLLQSKYNLGQYKTGVVYLEGIEGLKTLLEDMVRSKEEVLIIPSHYSSSNQEAWEILQKGVAKRAKQGVKSRIIFHEEARKQVDRSKFGPKKMVVRFWGCREYPGEIVVYGDKSVFTTYTPAVVNAILTNEVIAQTLRNLFEELWEKAKP